MKVTGIHLAVAFGTAYLLHELTHGHENENFMFIDARDSHGRTPLSRAASSGHKAVVKLLAERDDVEAGSKDNRGADGARGGHSG